MSYAGNGSTTTFSVNFYFLDQTHLKVILRSSTGVETVKTLSTDYTVTGAGNPAGGSITMVTAPASGQTLVIQRNVPLTQDTDYQPNDPFPANTHEQALDKLTMETQQIQLAVDRAIKFAETDDTALTNLIPVSNLRANKALIFDASGSVTVSIDDYNDQAYNAGLSAAAAAASAVTAAGHEAAAEASAIAAAASEVAAAGSASAASVSAASAAASVNAGMYSAVQDKSANYSVVAADAGDLIRVTTTSGAVTITLPEIGTTGIGDGFKIAVVKWTNDANSVNVVRSGTNTINGSNTYSIGSQFTSATFVADLETGQWFGAASGVGTANIVSDVFSGTGSQTAFTLSGDPGSKNNTFVYVGGVYQQKATYTQSGATITFSVAPPAGSSNIEIIWIQAQVIGVPSDGTVSLPKFSATGTPSSLTFLRGDNTWATPPAGFSGATTNAVSSSPITLTYNSNQYQVAQISSFTNSYVTLPDATTMLSIGSDPFVIENRSPYGANLELRNSAGTVVGYIPIGQIGTVQLVDKSTSAGRWNVEIVNPQTFFSFNSSSITAVTTTPVANGEQGIVGLTSTTFVRWWTVYTINGGTGQAIFYLYTQVGTISGSTITFGSIQSSNVFSLTAPAGSNAAVVTARAVRLSNTAFAVLMGGYTTGVNGCADQAKGEQRILVNTVSGTVVTFGTASGASMPTVTAGTYYNPQDARAAPANGAICRISDTVFAIVYNDGITNTYAWPYGFSGSMSCQIVSVSGTTMTIGTKTTLGTSTYSQPLSVVALSATSIFLCYAQAAATGGSTGRSKLVVISVSGTTATFNTPVTCEAADVACFYTLGGGATSAYSTSAAVAPSATQAVFATGYSTGEASVSGTVPTFNSFPYSSRLAPMYLSTASKAYTANAYLSIATGGFVTNTPVTDVLQTNLSVTAATPYSPLGAEPTTAFVAYRDGSTATVAASSVLLGSTT